MNIKKEKIKVYDMTCTSCESKLNREIEKLDGVKNVIASFSDQNVIVEYDSELCSTKIIKESITKAGYSTESSNVFNIVGTLIIVATVILLGSSTNGFDMNSKLNGATYFVLFIVGLLTSLHCVGMCGGIMLSQSITKESKKKLESITPAVLYNAGRVVSYTIAGGIVGALGSVLSLSLSVKAGLQIFAGIFMIIMGLNMSGFWLFRKFTLRLPWSTCSIKTKPKTPFFIGILNGLMPCGPLQTMQLYALGTGSAFKGAMSMFLFSLGTVPLMLTFGAISGLLSKSYTKKLLKFSGILIIVLGLIMGRRGLALAGVNLPTISFNSQNFAHSITGGNSSSDSNVTKSVIKNGIQTITMNADNRGYNPNVLYIQKNIPVRWIINGKQITSCNGEIVIPSLGIQKKLDSGENIIEFTPKDKDITFSCWMGMINGIIKVVDNIGTVNTSKTDPSLPSPSSVMSCCSSGSSATTQQKPSIYGNDISKISTDRLVHKAVISANIQSAKITGKGYEFEPLITVVNKGLKTKFTIDFNNFDNPDGKYSLVNLNTKKTVTTFEGKKGVVNVEFDIQKIDIYGITKDNNIIQLIDVVNDVKAADLNKIRTKYINQ